MTDLLDTMKETGIISGSMAGAISHVMGTWELAEDEVLAAAQRHPG